MKIRPFELERWQSLWENRVGINISESGVHPLSLGELLEEPGMPQELLTTPLGYPQTNGSELTRSWVAELYPGAGVSNVLMTSGCSEANFVIAWTLVEPGDEVVFMQPNYMQIGGVVESLGATIKPLRLREDLRWSFDQTKLRALITDRTKLIAICNPNNPTGAVLSEEAINALCDRASEVGAWILADEVYRGAEMEGPLTPSFWGRYERVLATGGLSKAYCLPGLRTGWIVGPPEMIARLWGTHDYTSIALSMLTDRLSAIALEPAKRQKIRERVRGILRQNLPRVRAWVEKHGLRMIPPYAGAVAWIGYDFDWRSDKFCEELRRKKDVLIVPGTQFGMPQFLRIGFGGKLTELEAGLALIDEFLAESLQAGSGKPTLQSRAV